MQVIMCWNRSLYFVSIIFFIILAFAQFSAGLKCYSCQFMNRRGDKDCLDSPPPSKYLTECNQPQCWKKEVRFNGQHSVQRYCAAAAGTSDKSYCEQSSHEDMFTGEVYPATECVCKSDGCNGSSRSVLHSTNTLYSVAFSVAIALCIRIVSSLPLKIM